MPGPSQPADVIRAVAAGVSKLATGNLNRDEREALADQLAALYAKSTDVRHPFAPFPTEPRRTREELRDHFAAPFAPNANIEQFEPDSWVIHQTSDPEVIVAEFVYKGIANGTRFELPNIFVVRVRNGEIVESRDYADHLAIARAFGEAPHT